MKLPRIVIDTNVLVAALRSRRGQSFRLLSQLGVGQFEFCVSVTLVLEYEDVLKRQQAGLMLNDDDIDVLIDYLCQQGIRQPTWFLWRPQLKDPKDEFLLELSLAGQCDFIVTHNLRDFAGIERFGVRPITPSEFLRLLEERP